MKYLQLLLLIGVLAQCSSNEEATYRPYREFLNEKTDPWKALKKPQPVSEFSIDSAWNFLTGDSTEGLQPQSPKTGRELVSLPHRILRPNTPLWYSKEIEIPSAGFLRIRADDGAQLFIGDTYVTRVRDEFFEVSEGKYVATIRVLNNAMNGGLRSVQFMTREAVEKYTLDVSRYNRIRHLVEQVVLLRDKPEGFNEKVSQAINDQTDASIADAEQVVEFAPYIIGPWVIKENNTLRIRAMTDIEQTVTLTHSSGSLQQTGKIFDFEINTDQPFDYKLTCRSTTTPLYHFDPTEQSKFSFNAWADSQSGWPTFQKNLDHLSEPRDAFGVGAGDLVGDGSDYEEWRSFYNVLSTHSPYMPFYLIAGNHDYDGFYDNLDPVYYRQLNRYDGHSYYSWAYGNCAFIMLDPNESFPIDIKPGSRQFEWFQNEIKSEQWKSATWRFVVLHQPPYSQGWEGYTGDHFLRRLLDPVAGDIDFVITGHTHDYERLTIGRTTYLIMGGGGGSLEPPESSMNPKMDTLIKKHHIGRFYVDGATIRFEAIDIDGNVIDTFIPPLSRPRDSPNSTGTPASK